MVQKFRQGISSTRPHRPKHQAGPDSRGKQSASTSRWGHTPPCTSFCNGRTCLRHLCNEQSALRSLCSHAKSGQINQAASMRSLERTKLNIHQSRFLNRLAHAGLSAWAAALHTSTATLSKGPSDNLFQAAHDLMH